MVLAAVMSLWGVFEYSRFESVYQQQFRDPYKVSAQFSRLAGVRDAVPENAIIGYVTDLPRGTITDNATFDGAQYVLAPRMLQRTTSSDWVLGDFAKPDDFASIGRKYGLRMERDFGEGVVLFRKEGR